MNKLGFWMIVIAAFFFGYNIAIAHDYHHHDNKTVVNNIYQSKGIASAISAAQCSFDGGSFDLQLCGAVGYSDNQEAFTFGAGKKYKDFLINGTISIESNEPRYGIGLNWKIK